MSRDQKVVRLANLTLASGLLGTTAAVRPVFLPLAVLGPIALWWRYDRLSRALLLGWIPALWAGLAVQTWTTVRHPSPLGDVVVSALATAAGLVVASQLLWRLRPWITDRLPHGHRAMLRIAHAGPHALATLYPAGGPILARGEQGRGLVVGRPHTLAVGPRDTDAMSSLLIANVMAWTSGAVVAVSTTPELLDDAGPLRARLGGGKVHVLDVLGILDGRGGVLPAAVHAVRWTPLRGCADWATARDRAAALLAPARTTPTVSEARHWATQSERLLAPLLHAAAACGLSLREVTSWAAGSPAQLEEALGLLHDLEGPGAREAHAQLRGVLHADARQRSTIVGTVTTALHPYAGHLLDEAAAAKESDWDPQAFLAGPNTLFVIAPADSEVDSLAPIVTGVLAELYGTVRRLSDARGGPLPHGTLWVLDEVATLCPLPGLPQWMAEAPGRGLSFLLGVHDLAHLAERWGSDGAAAICSSATARVVFPGVTSPSTLRQLELLGDHRGIPRVTTARPATGSRRDRRWRTTTAPGQLLPWTAATLYDMPASSCLVFRPDWPHPFLQPQVSARRTEPFASWHRMPWPVAEGELVIAGRRAVDAITPSVPIPPPR